MKRIGPQAGQQEKFLASSADICIYGGAAGGGKSVGLVLEAARYAFVPGFSAVLFRKTYGDITNPGGLWDASEEYYSLLGGNPTHSALKWEWPVGSIVMMSHFAHPKYKLNWQGSQICMIGWDELTHFSREIFFYMLSRNRSACGVRPYIRATCNPDADSWVRQFIGWWIGDDGYPIPARDGAVRWMVREDEDIAWYKSREAVPAAMREFAKSVSFIAAKLSDNPILMKKDPGYLANLMALPRHEREALLGGNWNIRISAGMYFKRHWFEIVDEIDLPTPDTMVVRYWDRASTEVSEQNTDPDWTAGVKMFIADGNVYVVDVERFRGRPAEVRQRIRTTASRDGADTEVWLEQDPGQAGVADVDALTLYLRGYVVKANRVSTAKAVRARPFSAHAEPPDLAERTRHTEQVLGLRLNLGRSLESAPQALTGRVYLLRAAWNDDYLAELEAFTGDQPGHDDQVDASSGAYAQISLYFSTPRVRMI